MMWNGGWCDLIGGPEPWLAQSTTPYENHNDIEWGVVRSYWWSGVLADTVDLTLRKPQ